MKTSLPIKISLIFLLLYSIGLQVEAQDFKTVLNQLREGFNENGKVHIKMEVKVFESKQNPTPLYHEKAEIKKNGNNYWYKYAQSQMLMNQVYHIVVDDYNKQIMCSNRDKSGLSSSVIQPDLDSIMNFYEEPIFVKNENGMNEYQLEQKSGEVKTIKLFVDDRTHMLKKMIYFYNEGHYVETIFHLFNKAPVFDPEEFNENKYVAINKNKKNAAPAYQQYQIVDMSH